MAFTPNRFLSANSGTFLRDQQHASKLFVDDGFRLAPKFDHLFHVAFSINPAALMNIELSLRHKNEINMLVKSVTLPKFTMATETVNQYNRKKVVQTQHSFEGTTVTFHDDNMGLINMLWRNYYSYYYADPSSANRTGAYNRVATKNANYVQNPYGLDNGSTIAFFNYITIYHMARHEYVAYKLHNPLIKSFDHKDLKYNGQSNTHENTMSLSYEAVSYTTGTVSTDFVQGFGLEHYDVTPSPLSGSSASTNASPTFTTQDIVANNTLENFNNQVSAINGYQNAGNGTATGTTGLLALDSTQTVGGLSGFTFPQSANISNSNTTVATKINIIK
jgi:hypothetical protein